MTFLYTEWSLGRWHFCILNEVSVDDICAERLLFCGTHRFGWWRFFDCIVRERKRRDFRVDLFTNVLWNNFRAHILINTDIHLSVSFSLYNLLKFMCWTCNKNAKFREWVFHKVWNITAAHGLQFMLGLRSRTSGDVQIWKYAPSILCVHKRKQI